MQCVFEDEQDFNEQPLEIIMSRIPLHCIALCKNCYGHFLMMLTEVKRSEFSESLSYQWWRFLGFSRVHLLTRNLYHFYFNNNINNHRQWLCLFFQGTYKVVTEENITQITMVYICMIERAFIIS